MFDRLIETNSEAADLRARRKYFAISSLAVGTFFFIAVVVSIYATELSLGTNQFELSSIIAPVDAPPDRPEPIESRKQSTREEQSRDTEIPIRQAHIARVDEHQQTPNEVSVTQNPQMARPETKRYQLGPYDSGLGHGAPGLGNSAGGGDVTGTSVADNSKGSESEFASKPSTESIEPPPLPPTRPPIKSLGVINGKAKDLPMPDYPATARSLNVQGKVDVQVTIDEQGKVISAKAVSGHPTLRGAAEKAAWGARFTPTLLSNVPVKVTGVIVYNFTRN